MDTLFKKGQRVKIVNRACDDYKDTVDYAELTNYTKVFPCVGDIGRIFNYLWNYDGQVYVSISIKGESCTIPREWIEELTITEKVDVSLKTLILEYEDNHNIKVGEIR